ncbi:MAG: NAD(P)H-dependent oxidoreductase, partial [Pseudomonadota bacterium]
QMAEAARGLDGITFLDLYAEYPRHDIDVDKEQARLLAHNVIVFQFPLYWYSTPSLLKEWQDLVLQHGFAYGHDGDKLAGKSLLVAITAGGSDDAYTPKGYQHYPLRAFLTPLEQTARLCKMEFLTPFVLYSALKADEATEIAAHAKGYGRLLSALRDDTVALPLPTNQDVLTASDLGTLLTASQEG